MNIQFMIDIILACLYTNTRMHTYLCIHAFKSVIHFGLPIASAGNAPQDALSYFVGLEKVTSICAYFVQIFVFFSSAFICMRASNKSQNHCFGLSSKGPLFTFPLSYFFSMNHNITSLDVVHTNKHHFSRCSAHK